MEQSSLAVFSALWLGILTSVSPCPLSTNIAAVSYVGRQVGSPWAVLLAGGMYTGGRMLAYLVLGAAAVWSVMSVVLDPIDTATIRALCPAWSLRPEYIRDPISPFSS